MKKGIVLKAKQKGVSLIEAMIGLALSLIVTSSMVVLMSNSLGTATSIIQMSQLTDELRGAMSIVSRDVRRANYNINAIYCYANSDCATDGSASQFADVLVGDSVTVDDCIIFGLDRNWDGDASNDGAGAFRRVVSDGVGQIEMWVGGSKPDSCTTASANWMPLTDSNIVHISALTISDDDSFEGSILEEGGTYVTKRTRRVDLEVVGQLVKDQSITRRMRDSITVRNDFIL